MYWPPRSSPQYDRGPWCEAERHEAFLREPANSLSDLTFLVFVVFAFVKGINDFNTKITKRQNLILRRPELTIAFALGNMYHFLGTFFNHACCCHIGHVADAGGMYSIIFFISVYNIGRISKLPEFYPNCKEGKRTRVMLVVYILGSLLLIPYADVYYSSELCKFRETLGVACLAISAALTYSYYFYRSEKLSRSRLQFQWAISALMLLAGTFECALSFSHPFIHIQR